MSPVVAILLTLLLLALNALFVAAEFALISARRTHVGRGAVSERDAAGHEVSGLVVDRALLRRTQDERPQLDG